MPKVGNYYSDAHEDAIIMFGALIDPHVGNGVGIVVLMCDFPEAKKGAEEKGGVRINAPMVFIHC